MIKPFFQFERSFGSEYHCLVTRCWTKLRAEYCWASMSDKSVQRGAPNGELHLQHFSDIRCRLSGTDEWKSRWNLQSPDGKAHLDHLPIEERVCWASMGRKIGANWRSLAANCNSSIYRFGYRFSVNIKVLHEVVEEVFDHDRIPTPMFALDPEVNSFIDTQSVVERKPFSTRVFL